MPTRLDIVGNMGQPLDFAEFDDNEEGTDQEASSTDVSDGLNVETEDAGCEKSGLDSPLDNECRVGIQSEIPCIEEVTVEPS